MSAPAVVSAAELEALMAELVPIGLDGAGATTRLAWSEEDELAGSWFAERAAERALAFERDPAGNLWATPEQPPPWWAVGSHLDSVLRGGRYDGALGVAAAFAVAARAPVAVIAFADEEGARFNTPTFGSRALTGALDLADALGRSDAGGVTLGDALRGAGLDPAAVGSASARLQRLRGFLELHIDQTRALARARVPVAAVSGLAARARTQVLIEGRADHAGTTSREERHDALGAAARLIVAAEELAGEQREMLFTAARIEVEPNASSTVPALARIWFDARAGDPERVARWSDSLAERAAALARERHVSIELRRAAFSPGIEFPQPLRATLRSAAASAAGVETVPELLCWAGHDAGILAERIPAGMLLVRNRDGVSHSPREQVSLEDAAVGTQAIVNAIGALA